MHRWQWQHFSGFAIMSSKDAADQNFDYMFKLLIIGNSSVGKTSFLFRYADDSFDSSFVSTVGIDFKVKTMFRQDKRVKLQIWVSELRSSCAVLHLWNCNSRWFCALNGLTMNALLSISSATFWAALYPKSSFQVV